MLVDTAYDAWVQAPADEKEARLEDLHRAIASFSDRFLRQMKGESIRDLGTDVASDVLVKLDSFQGDSKFSTWVGAIIKNQWADKMEERVFQRERFVELRTVEFDEDWEDKGDPAAADSKAQEDLTRSVLISQIEQRVPERDKELFSGVVRDGKTVGEVARDLGLDPDAVESRFRRLKKRFREDFEKLGDK